MDSYDSLLQAEHALNDARSNDVQLNQDLRLNEKRRAEYVAHWEPRPSWPTPKRNSTRSPRNSTKPTA
jgi:hypothetical protein